MRDSPYSDFSDTGYSAGGSSTVGGGPAAARSVGATPDSALTVAALAGPAALPAAIRSGTGASVPVGRTLGMSGTED